MSSLLFSTPLIMIAVPVQTISLLPTPSWSTMPWWCRPQPLLNHVKRLYWATWAVFYQVIYYGVLSFRHVWQSLLIVIQSLNTAMRTTVESVKRFVLMESMTAVWSSAFLIQLWSVFHLDHSSSLEIQFWSLAAFCHSSISFCQFSIICRFKKVILFPSPQ